MSLPPTGSFLDQVPVGSGRITVLALVSAEAEVWDLLAWMDLRESGVCAVLAPFRAPEPAREAGVPVLEGPVGGPWSLPDGRLVVCDEPVWDASSPENTWLLDGSGRLSAYPSRRRLRRLPWGWIARDLPHEDVLPMMLAACAAGAELLAVPVSSPKEAAEMVDAVKDLASALRREVTRIPKSPEGRSFRAASVSSDDGGRLYSEVPGKYRVAYQGEPGAFSEMAVFTLFPPSRTEAVPMKTFRDAFTAVLDREVDFAAIPFENALAGPVQDNYDLMLEFRDIGIVAETQVRVEHNLIGLPGSSIAGLRRVFSHPQALAQSRRFLEDHPEWEAVPYYDTAGSVGYVSRTGDFSWAAIASAEAARVWNMQILAAGIETNHHNFTRFFLLAPKEVEPVSKATKASLLFSTPDTPGALSRCLAVFSNHGLNMKKLESRPIPGKPWEYMFYVDVSLPDAEQTFSAAWEELQSVSLDLRLLGRYPGRSDVHLTRSAVNRDA